MVAGCSTPSRSILIALCRFVKLPPGFTQELRYHIAEGNPPIDPVTNAPIIDFENYCCGMGLASWLLV